MSNFRGAYRSLFRKGRNNILKILSLGVGLAMGLVLISKVFFEFTYDDFFPDHERIYLIVANYISEDGNPDDHHRVSGAIAPGMKAEIPEVEAATRWTHFGSILLKATDNYKYMATSIFADSGFFDVLPRPMIIGNAKETLGRPGYALISEKMAKKMGGVKEVVGKVFEIEHYPGRTITIGGVFKDLPKNSHLKYDVIFSMNSIAYFMYDGSENWLGNDRYWGYVKLYPGMHPEDLYPAFRKMQEKYQPLEEMEESGYDTWYTLRPLKELHAGLPEVIRMALLLSLLALAIIFTATMNYVLIVLSSLVSRAKEMAVYKSYGADKKEIMKVMITETLLHLFLSLLVASFLIYLFQSKIEEILSVSIPDMMSLKIVFGVSLVCLIVFLVSGVIPAVLYARIPVTTAFRNYKESRRKWKQGSLFIQFAASCFLLVLLVVIWKQYNFMIHDDPGYNTENVIYFYGGNSSVEQRRSLLSELNQFSFTESVSTFSILPIWGPSGSYVREGNNQLFTFVDLSTVDYNYLTVMRIPLLQGGGFTENMPDHMCIVDRNFAEKLISFTGWQDGVVGKNITLEGGRNVHICGVYENIRVGSILYEDSRPSMMFYGKTAADNKIIMRLNQMSPENMLTIERTIKTFIPGEEISIVVLKNEVQGIYYDSKLFRDSVIISGIVVFIISIIGLIGYLQDEINRRRSEIAIRRINGGTVKDILRLFIKDILYIAMPALITGSIIAYLAAQKWLEGFSVKTDLTVGWFLLCGIFILIIITGVVVRGIWHKTKENPVNSLRTD